MIGAPFRYVWLPSAFAAARDEGRGEVKAQKRTVIRPSLRAEFDPKLIVDRR
jgi:hypothetical protein